MKYFDLIAHTVASVPAEERLERISPDHPTTVRATAHRVASELGWGVMRIERFGAHCESYAERNLERLTDNYVRSGGRQDSIRRVQWVPVNASDCSNLNGATKSTDQCEPYRSNP